MEDKTTGFNPSKVNEQGAKKKKRTLMHGSQEYIKMQKRFAKNPEGGTWADFRNTWQLFKLNYRPFLKTMLFSLLAGLATILLVSIIFLILRPLFPELQDFSTLRESVFIFFVQAIIAASALIIAIFQNCQNGLAYDIMSSGDMYTEFKNSFNYFRRYWWQYLLLSFILYAIPNVLTGMHDFHQFGDMYPGGPLIQGFGLFEVLVEFCNFIWFVLFISTFPSITAQGNFKNAFIENFRMLRANPKRMFGTWGVYYLIFRVPTAVFSMLLSIYHLPIFAVLTIIWATFSIVIGGPLQYLLAAGLYHNIEFNRYQPLTEE